MNLSELNDEFFPSGDGREVQFLVPLIVVSDIVGFIVVGVLKTELAEFPEFEARISDYADQIVDLLCLRSGFVAEERQQTKTLAAFGAALFGSTPEQRTFEFLKRESHSLEGHLYQLERLYDDSDSPSSVYDVFGNLLMTNHGMSRLLTESKTAGHVSATAITFAEDLTGQSASQCRRMIRNVLMQQNEETFTIHRNNRTWLLKIRPLRADRTGIRPSVTPAVFATEGIVFELLDQTRFEVLYDARLTVTEEFGNKLRNDLAAVDFAASILNSDIPDDERREIHELIHQKVGSAVAALTETQAALSADDSNEYFQCCPVDTMVHLSSAADAARSRGRQRSIDINITTPALRSQVFANRAYLKGFFTACFNLLLIDSRDSTSINVCVTEEEELVNFDFSNTGYGMTNDQLRLRLQSAEEAENEEYARFQEAMTHLESWGGRIAATSAIGSGLEIRVSFRRFH